MKSGNKEDLISMRRSIYKVIFILIMISFPGTMATAWAVDSDITRSTLSGLKGVYVLVEDLNPNILKYEKYLKKFDLSKEQIQKEVELKLKPSGIKTFSYDEWLKTPGRPVLYISVNTHENDKYWFAYDVRVELRQLVLLEANPKIKTLAPTWSMSTTGMTSIGNFQIIHNDMMVLLDKFINAFRSANKGS
jgi:hypothetical protein